MEEHGIFIFVFLNCICILQRFSPLLHHSVWRTRFVKRKCFVLTVTIPYRSSLAGYCPLKPSFFKPNFPLLDTKQQNFLQGSSPGFLCIHRSSVWAVLAGCCCMELNLLQVQVPAPREEGLCSRLGPSCLARCVGTQLRPLESRKASGAWLCPWDRRCGEQRQPQSSALPAWGHSIPAERGQHEAPPSIQPCAKSEARDAIFPPLHSFLWFFTRHLLALTQSGVQI